MRRRRNKERSVVSNEEQNHHLNEYIVLLYNMTMSIKGRIRQLKFRTTNVFHLIGIHALCRLTSDKTDRKGLLDIEEKLITVLIIKMYTQFEVNEV